MTFQNSKLTDQSLSAFYDYDGRNQGNNTTSRRDVTVGQTDIVSERSNEESPLPKPFKN